ncbi:MAG: hypothetical protein WCL06_10460 [Bacteroidota bacterium]
MRIKRKILKIRSRFYYYVLLLIGSTTVLFLTRCGNPKAKEDASRKNDSIALAHHLQDSTATADSLQKAEKIQAAIDSIHQADSVAKARQKAKSKPQTPHQFVPVQPVVDYGVMPNETPATKYGVPVNNYKN